MKPLLSSDGLRALKKLPLNKTLMAFDFDGTLAPLMRDPGAVFTYEELLAPLAQLNRHSKIAVISGRGLEDLRPRLHFSTDFLAGNHGLEGVPQFQEKAERAKLVCRQWVTNLRIDCAEYDRGLMVEDKKYSLALHYRFARDKASARSWLKREIAKLEPSPRIIPGKLLFNLIPKGAPHKGTALNVIMKDAGCTRALYLGDDYTDEDVFRSPATRSGKVLSVRVGASMKSAAPYFLRGHKDVVRLLKYLVEM